MIRRLAVGVVILAVLLAAAVGLLTWQFSGLVTPRIESYLTGYGVESLSTSEVQWRFNHLRIEDIRARGAIEDMPFELHLERVDVGYQWWRLFNGTIDSIAIGSTRIDLALPASTDAAPGAALAIEPLLPQAWLQALPVASLTLDEVSGSLRLPGGRVLGLAGSDWQLAGDELEVALGLRELEAGVAPVATTMLVLVDVASSAEQPLDISVGITNAGRLVANLALSRVANSALDGLEFAVHGEVNHRNFHRTVETLRSAGHPLLASVENLPDELPAVKGDTRLRLLMNLPSVIAGEVGDWLLDGALHGSVRHRLSWEGWPDPTVGEARAQLRYGLAGSLRALDITLQRPATVEGELSGAGAALPESFAEWQRQTPFRLEVSTDHPLAARAGELSLEAVDARLVVGPEGQHLAVEARLTDLLAGEQGSSASAAFDIGLQRGGQPLLAVRVDGQARHSAGALQLSGSLAESALAVDGQWQASMAEDGRYRFSLDGRTANLAQVLETADALVPLDIPLALTAGTGRLRYRLEGVSTAEGEDNGGEEPAPDQHITLNLAGLTGLLGAVAVNDAALDAVIEGDGQWQSSGAIELRVGRLRAGVTVDDISASLRLLPSPSLEQTLWSADSFHARLFGGDVRLEAPVEVALPLDEAAFNLVLSDWQLGEIFALYADHGLSGSGVMSGILPVRLADEGISIIAGELVGQPPGGTIVYDGGEAGDAVAAGNQQLDVALRLLSNFQYDTLAVRTDFAPDGELLLGLRLAGNNPDQFDGQAVDFNINVEENLFDLLRALQLTDEVIKQLENRLRR